MTKEIKITVVSFEEFTDIEFTPPSIFYYKNALGDLVFIHTSKRQVAQDYVDEVTGVKGKYKVIASKLQKEKSKQENGEVSVRGTQSRRMSK